MGWDDDKSGDYVPPPLPRWIWLSLAVFGAGIVALGIFCAGLTV